MAEQTNTPATAAPVAVMDLGTNTFHLLIATGSRDDFKVLYRATNAVKIGEGGISKGVIQPEPFKRGLQAMQEFADQIKAAGATQVRAIATSALRNAVNGQDFVNAVQKQTGINIEVISGEQEAQFIYEGIKASGALTRENALILDIGGGSVEFIIGNADQVLWKQSFEIGAARLMTMFHKKDPIPVQAIKDMTTYLNSQLVDLFKATLQYKPKVLIGSSGSFESFAEMIETRNNRNFSLEQTKLYEFDTDELLETIEWLVKSNHAQRAAKKEIIPVRVDMIVTASLLTIYMMQKLGLVDVTLSTYSLKEGVMAEMM